MLLVPQFVLLSICFNASASVLGVIKIPLDYVMQMWVEERTQRYRLCFKTITLAGDSRRKNLWIMY